MPCDIEALKQVPFFGLLDDEELATDGAVLEIPATLSPHIAFLSDNIRVYDESNARVQTPVRRFLDTKLVNRFRVEDIFKKFPATRASATTEDTVLRAR